MMSDIPKWAEKGPYMAKQLRDYRDGNRSDPQMSSLSQTLTDAQIEALSAYYAKQPADGA
jgi:cytochrome c553